MKMTAILLLAGCLHVTAAGFGQKISLSRDNVSLTKVFGEIKKQTGYTFFYNVRAVNKAPKISLHVTGAGIQEVMEQCLKGLPFTWKIVNKTIVVSEQLPENMPEPVARDTVPSVITVTGKVTDELNGEPIAGASIGIKGLAGGTTTNTEGVFSIAIKPGAVLVFSSIGFKTKEITVTKPGAVNIKLTVDKSSDPMANVVITGYQQIDKESYTGNAVTVSGADLRKVNPQNMLQSLQTFDPSFKILENNLQGSDPNALPKINVRGSTSLPSGSGDVLDRNNLASNVNLPTFIMDGYEVSLQKVYDMDINRIQSITLLKDAAATAVYGSRAANGVVVITTKSPVEGKLQVTYNFDLNVTGPDLTDYNLLNASEKLQYEKLAGLYNAVGSLSADEQEERFYAKMKNVVSGVNTYWLSQPLTTAIGQRHSLYLEGGSPTMRYGVELRYQTNPGVMKDSKRDRYNLGMSLSYNPGKNLIFKNVLTVTQVKSQESPYGGFWDYIRMNPYYPKTDSSGRIIQAVDDWLIDTRTSGAGQFRTDVVLNPLYNATLSSFNRNDYLELIDAFNFDWTIAYGLRLQTLLSFTKRKTENDIFSSPFSNAFYFYGNSQLNERGSYSKSNVDENGFDGNVRLSYNRQLGNHFINGVLGANVQTYLYDLSYFSAVGFSNDRFTNIGFANSYPDNGAPNSYKFQERLAGSFFTLNYSFRNKILADLTVRTDGSSKFGTANKVAPFWAFGLGWNLHKERFLQNTAVSMLRLRASTGITGSVNFPAYMSKSTFTYRGDWYSTGVGATVNNYGNENLSWERTYNYDIGLDIGLFKDRLFLSPRYFSKLTKGLLADIILPPSAGFNAYKENLGDMKNSGVELNFKYAAIRNKTWTVNFTANLSHIENKIVRISNALEAYNDKADEEQTKDEYLGVPLLRFKEGQSLNTIYAVRSLGIDPENGKEIFIKKDGSLTYDWDVRDIVPVADGSPDAEGFFGTSITYKRFLVNILFYTRFGGYEYNQTLVDRVENADPRYNVDRRVLEERWINPGDKALYKNIADLGTTNTSDRFVQKDNIVELNSFYMSYDFAKPIYQKLAMKSLRLSFTMNNMVRWSTIKMERGLNYPFARNFTFSIQTGF